MNPEVEKKYIRLKITGDGTSENTHIIDEETGRELDLAQEIGIIAHVDKPFVECYMHLLNVKLDLVAHANLEHLKKGVDKFEVRKVCALCEKACPEGENDSSWLTLGISNSLPTNLTDVPKVDYYKSICPHCIKRIQGPPEEQLDVMITYLQIARIALDRDDVRDQVMEALSLSDEDVMKMTEILNTLEMKRQTK